MSTPVGRSSVTLSAATADCLAGGCPLGGRAWPSVQPHESKLKFACLTRDHKDRKKHLSPNSSFSIVSRSPTTEGCEGSVGGGRGRSSGGQVSRASWQRQFIADPDDLSTGKCLIVADRRQDGGGQVIYLVAGCKYALVRDLLMPCNEITRRDKGNSGNQKRLSAARTHSTERR